MKIKSVRSKQEMQPVLQSPNCDGPDPVYWVFSEISHSKWSNLTVIPAGRYYNEYPKTFGHYHTTSKAYETYSLIHGSGVLLLQKKYMEGTRWVQDMVSEVYLVKFDDPGDVIIIPNDYGHGWSNVGDTPLMTMDDWRSGHSSYDYEPIKSLGGMVYYLVEESAEIFTVPNPNYRNHPEPKWVTPEEFCFFVGQTIVA